MTCGCGTTTYPKSSATQCLALWNRRPAEDALRQLDAIYRSEMDEKYMAGERSQQLLDFDQAKAALKATADQGQEQLGFGS